MKKAFLLGSVAVFALLACSSEEPAAPEPEAVVTDTAPETPTGWAMAGQASRRPAFLVAASIEGLTFFNQSGVGD